MGKEKKEGEEEDGGKNREGIDGKQGNEMGTEIPPAVPKKRDDTF